MSSETITRNDLTNILNEVLPPMGGMTLNPWAYITATGFTGNNTATKVTGTTIRSGGNASDYFDTSVSNQITIKKAGTYKIIIFFRITAITSASNVKRISCYNNGSEFCVAMSRTQSWEDVQSTTIAGCSVGDVLTMYRRAEDGNSTYAPALILIEAVSSTSGNISAEADYIVEQGTDANGWKYRKWNSGFFEADIVVASPTWGTASTINGVIRQQMTLPTVPTMVTKLGIYASGINSGSWVVSGLDSSMNPNVYVYRISGSVTPPNVSVHIRGTWK